MADYIYLLQTRLTRAQQAALEAVREVARAQGLTVFLVGGAVRDMTSGAPVRDLDVVVQGNALNLQSELEGRGAKTLGSYPVMQTLHMNFPGGVRLGVESTLQITYPKPGKPVAEPANILDDLRRRDFTANAMAISLNEGSYGLLMDPMNGVADIENRELRLVSNYGFIEDPARMLRGVRLGARLGWQFEEKTQQRYETGKAEEYISAMTPESRNYEIEDIFHEEEPLRILRRFEEEGWGKYLFPALQSSRANEGELERLRDLVDQFQTMGVFPDPSAANFPLLTAKMQAGDLAELKRSFARPGFVEQIDALDASTKEFSAKFTAKNVSAPSETWKMLLSSSPEQILWLAFTSKNAGIQSRFKAFFDEWPSARQRIPYGIMQEMRITPDLPGYNELLESLFFALMDGKLDTPEAIREFLSPFSPPAPPPPVNVRRRPAKRESKSSRSKSKAAAKAVSDEDAAQEIAGDESDVPQQAVSAENSDAPAKTSAKKAEGAPKPAPVEKNAEPTAKPAPTPKKAAQPTASKQPAKAAVKAPAKAVKVAVTAAKKATPAKAKTPATVAAKKSVAKTTAKKVAAKKQVPPTRSAKKALPAKKTAAKLPVKKAPAKKQPAKASTSKAAKKSRR